MDIAAVEIASFAAGAFGKYILAKISNKIGMGIGSGITNVRKGGKEKIRREFWSEYFPTFIDFEEGFQSVIGAYDIGGPYRLNGFAARKTIIPDSLRIPCEHSSLQVVESYVEDIALNTNKNTILYGGLIPSDLAAEILMNEAKYGCRFRFGLKEKHNNIIYDINKKELNRLREKSKIKDFRDKWVIIDTYNEQVLCDSSPVEDGAIIIRADNPTNPDRDILAFMGVGATGTHLSGLVFQDPKYIKTFEEQLKGAGIHGEDPFQAVIQLRFKSDKRIRFQQSDIKYLKIVSVEPL